MKLKTPLQKGMASSVAICVLRRLMILNMGRARVASGKNNAIAHQRSDGAIWTQRHLRVAVLMRDI